MGVFGAELLLLLQAVASQKLICVSGVLGKLVPSTVRSGKVTATQPFKNTGMHVYRKLLQKASEASWEDEPFKVRAIVHTEAKKQALIEMVNHGYTCGDGETCDFMSMEPVTPLEIEGGLMPGEVRPISDEDVMVADVTEMAETRAAIKGCDALVICTSAELKEVYIRAPPPAEPLVARPSLPLTSPLSPPTAPLPPPPYRPPLSQPYPPLRSTLRSTRESMLSIQRLDILTVSRRHVSSLLSPTCPNPASPILSYTFTYEMNDDQITLFIRMSIGSVRRIRSMLRVSRARRRTSSSSLGLGAQTQTTQPTYSDAYHSQVNKSHR